MVKTIAVPTKNRTAVLHRCLESLRDNAKKYERAIQFLVVDDSDDGSNITNYRVLQELGVPFRYYDRGAVDDFAQHLSHKAGCSLELTRFAFNRSPEAYGAARNFLLLTSPNEPFVMVDDDMVCKFASHESEAEIMYDIKPEISYQDMKVVDGVDAKGLIDVDFLGVHERAFEHVPLTCGGSIGDSGITSNYVYFLSRSVIKQMSSPGSVQEVLNKRTILRVEPYTRVLNWIYCIGMSMGLDTTQSMFPPFLPFGRGEDAFFGGLFRNCFHKRSAYLNYAMWHTRERETDLEKELMEFTNPVLGNLFYLLLVEINPVDLDMFGQTLSYLSSTDLSWVLERWRARTIGTLQRASIEAPWFLIDELQMLINRFKDTPITCMPSPQTVKNYGELLIAWPKIYEVAQDYGKQL